jgi:hypothetical protein
MVSTKNQVVGMLKLKKFWAFFRAKNNFRLILSRLFNEVVMKPAVYFAAYIFTSFSVIFLSQRMTRRSTTLCNSRMLPDQFTF